MRRFLDGLETAVLILTAVFLFMVLRQEAPAESPVRQHIIESGAAETGALNLVTSIYLGYRAFDTLGETIVLLVSVTGVVYFLKEKKEKDEKENRHP